MYLNEFEFDTHNIMDLMNCTGYNAYHTHNSTIRISKCMNAMHSKQ